MNYSDNRHVLLEQARAGTIERTVDYSTLSQLDQQTSHLSVPRLRDTLEGRVSIRDYLSEWKQHNSRVAQFSILFDTYEDFEELCIALYPGGLGREIARHEKSHADSARR